MKFGLLIEYSMRNIFLEKSYTKCDGETIPKPFPIPQLKLFKNKKKKRSGTSLPASFSALILKNKMSLVIFH